MPRRRDRSGKRDNRQVVNMNAEEKPQIEEGAKMMGVSISGFLITAGLEKLERMKEQKRAERALAHEFASRTVKQGQ